MYNLQKITIIWQYIMFHAVFCLKVVFWGRQSVDLQILKSIPSGTIKARFCGRKRESGDRYLLGIQREVLSFCAS